MESKGREPMGSRKHGKSGHAGKSPRFRFHARMEAERDVRKPKALPLTHKSVAEALKAK